jgi:hypothetical protein
MKITTSTKMKTVLVILSLSATALIAGAQDNGQNGPPGQGGDPNQGGGPGFGGGGRHHHPPLPAVVLALDVNHDGIISSNEIANASAELLTLDKNGDGQLTMDEYMGKRPGPPPDENGGGNDGPPPGAPDESTNTPPGGDQGFFGGHHHPPFPAIIRALDVNHDGIIDSNEIANASAELLTLDKNNDGQLTRKEYMGRPPGHRGGGGPDGPPPGGDDNGPGGPPPDADGNGGPPDDPTAGSPPMQQ